MRVEGCGFELGVEGFTGQICELMSPPSVPSEVSEFQMTRLVESYNTKLPSFCMMRRAGAAPCPPVPVDQSAACALS